MLKEPELEYNTNFIFNNKLEIEQKTTQEIVDDQSLFNTLDIYIIEVTLLARLAKKPKYIIFAIIMANIKKALVLKKYINFGMKVLAKYYKYLDGFL